MPKRSRSQSKRRRPQSRPARQAEGLADPNPNYASTQVATCGGSEFVIGLHFKTIGAALGICQRQVDGEYEMKPEWHTFLPLIWILSMRRQYLQDKGFQDDGVVTGHGTHKRLILSGYPELEGRCQMVLDKCCDWTTTPAGKRIASNLEARVDDATYILLVAHQ